PLRSFLIVSPIFDFPPMPPLALISDTAIFSPASAGWSYGAVAPVSAMFTPILNFDGRPDPALLVVAPPVPAASNAITVKAATKPIISTTLDRGDLPRNRLIIRPPPR